MLNNLSEYLSCFRDRENIYYLNKAGRERICSEIVRQKINPVDHYLMRNDVYIHLKPTEWKNEVKVGVGDIVIVADAYFKHEQCLYFLEVDHLQHMNVNQDKIEKYKKLKATGVFQEKFKYFPRLMWVTLTENRREQLMKWCEGLNTKVYLWEELK